MIRNYFGDNWLYDSYHSNRPQRGRIYLTYLIIGMLSFIHWSVLLIVLIPWSICLVRGKRMTFRSWIASVLGLLTPYWLKLAIGILPPTIFNFL